jgi:cytochrome P450
MQTPRIAPGPRGHHLVGHLPEIQADPLGMMLEGALEFGSVVRFNFGPMIAHLVSSPDGARHVLQENNHNYGRQTRGYQIMSETLGDGLLTTEGDFWRRQRRIEQPAFHRDRIAGFAALMTSAAEAMVKRWRGSATPDTAFDLTPELLRVTLRILGLSMFGIDLSEEADNIGKALVTVLHHTTEHSRNIFRIPDVIPTPANRRFKEALRALDRIVFGMIAERRREGRDHGDLLSMLLAARDEETGEGMDDQQLRDELVTILLAGHETTAMALSWTFYLLSKSPPVRRRLQAELGEVLGGRSATLADLPKLRYLRMVIEESMRLYPPAWAVFRSATGDDVVDGFAIPAGSIVIISPYVTHRLPSLWEDPEGFDPERFATEDPNRPRYAYYPFGGGPHLCIGNNFAMLEAQLVLATVAQHYRLDVVPGHPVEPEPLITLRPKEGVRVTAHAL